MKHRTVRGLVLLLALGWIGGWQGPHTNVTSSKIYAQSTEPIYLPRLLTPGPLAPTRSEVLGEMAFIDRRTAAMAVRGDRAYLGAGPYVVTYDISRPGAARRIGESLPAPGRLVHLRLGSDRLFAISRPDAAGPRQSLGNRNDPFWRPHTVLNIYDLDNRERPQLLESLDFVGLLDSLNLVDRQEGPHFVKSFGCLKEYYALDLAAYDQRAFISLVPSCVDSDAWRERSRPIGISLIPDDGVVLIADAAQEPAQITRLAAIEGFQQRLTVIGDRLIGSAHFDTRIRSGSEWLSQVVLEFDLKNPGTPLIEATGFESSEAISALSEPSWFLTGREDRLFQLYDVDPWDSRRSVLMTRELDAVGKRQILGWNSSDDPGFVDRLPSFETPWGDGHGFWYADVGIHDRLFALNAQHALLTTFDVGEPLEATLGMTVPLGIGPDLYSSPQRTTYATWIDDAGSALAASTTDSRLLVAGGERASLIEIDSSDPSQLAEPDARTDYLEPLGNDCAIWVDAGRSLAVFDGRVGELRVLDMRQALQPSILGRLSLSPSPGDCALAASPVTPIIYLASSRSLTAIELSNPSNPELASQTGGSAEPQDLIATEESLFLADNSGGLLIYSLEDPNSPRSLTRLDIDGMLHDMSVNESETRLFLAMGNDGIVTVDIQHAEAPHIVSRQASEGSIEALAIYSKQLFTIELPRSTPLQSPKLQARVLEDDEILASPNWYWLLADGSQPHLAIDPSAGASLYVADGPAHMLWFDIQSSMPEMRGRAGVSSSMRQILPWRSTIIAPTIAGLSIVQHKLPGN